MTEILIMIIIVMVLVYMFILYRNNLLLTSLVNKQKELIGDLEGAFKIVSDLNTEQKKYISVIESQLGVIPKQKIYNVDDILGEISLKGIDKVDKDKLDYLKNYGKDNKG